MAKKGTQEEEFVITIRLPRALGERIDGTRELVSDRREFMLKSRITRSDLVRYLILRGLEVVEEEESG